MAGRSKSKAQNSLSDEVWQEREDAGLRCLEVLGPRADKPNQLAKTDGTNQLAGFVDADTEENDETALARARDWAEEFLRTLARRGTILAAYREAGVSRAHVYRLMEASPTFRRAVDVAREEFVEHLEDVAVRRAEGGSDRMLEVLLRAASPRYRDGGQTVNVAVGNPIIVDVVGGEPGADLSDV